MSINTSKAARVALLIAAVLTSASPAFAQWSLDSDVQDDRARMIEMVGNFVDDPSNDMAFGYWNQQVAAAGREDLIAKANASRGEYAPMLCGHGDPLSLAPLVEAARNTNIVIVSEHHARPDHRLFVGELAEALSAEGYNYYAAETFTPETPGNETDVTLFSDGYYTRDPVFAAVLEDIRALGYTLIAYEQTEAQGIGEGGTMEEQIKAREQAQSDNLMSHLLAENPDAKVLIHVGHAHVYEFSKEGAPAWMAERLKEASGIDPLTINVADCTSPTDEPVLTGYAQWPKGNGISLNSDVYVGLTPPVIEDGRPLYRDEAGYRRVDVPQDLLPAETPVLIEARREGASDREIPLDRLYLRPGETGIPLLLQPGTYDVRSFDREGDVAGPVTISVED